MQRLLTEQRLTEGAVEGAVLGAVPDAADQFVLVVPDALHTPAVVLHVQRLVVGDLQSTIDAWPRRRLVSHSF